MSPNQCTSLLVGALAVGLCVAGLCAQAPDKAPPGDKKPVGDKKADEVLTVPAVQNGDSHTLRGKHKKVVIDSVTGGGTLDTADDFEAEEITIAAVEGGGRVVLKRADKGTL